MQFRLPAKSLSLLGLALLLSLTGIQCLRGTPKEVQNAIKPVTLTWWRTFDDEGAVHSIIESYRAVHPNVTIEYRKLRFEDYERELLNALAEDRGPDIVSMHNTWMRAYAPKLVPLPSAITLPYSELKGTIRKEVVTTLRTNPSLSLRALKTDFTDTITDDVVMKSLGPDGRPAEQIYGLPLSLDTLVMYVNRDLLNLAGVATAPRSWAELQAATKKLTRLDTKGHLLQSGAAIGSSRNVERAADIVALLMMQNGAEMMNPQGVAVFDKIPSILGQRQIAPGAEALAFYTDFANPQKETYTYSASEQGSLETFLSGRTAIFFGYSYHLPIIRARAPRLNLTIANMPQIEGNPEVNFANYWVETISKKSPNQNWAWDFIQFATRPQQVAPYLTATKKPTALRVLINSQLEDESIGTFASQLLTAKTWYHGNNATAAEGALLTAIDDVLLGSDPSDALKLAALKVNQTVR